MKNLIKNIFALTTAFILMLSCSFTVLAENEVEDYEFNVTRATMTKGTWGQSFNIAQNEFKCSRFTEDTIVMVEFELDGESTTTVGPCELILQNYSTADPAIWAKVTPFEYTETTASFKYDDMVAAYGFDDFTGVDTLLIGDTGKPLLVTKLTATNCTVPPAVTTVTTTEATETEITETEAEVTTTVVANNSSDTQVTTEDDIPVVLIVVVAAIVVIVIIVIVVISIRKKRGKFY